MLSTVSLPMLTLHNLTTLPVTRYGYGKHLALVINDMPKLSVFLKVWTLLIFMTLAYIAYIS